MEWIQIVKNLNLTKDKQRKVSEKRKLFSRPESILSKHTAQNTVRLMWTESLAFLINVYVDARPNEFPNLWKDPTMNNWKSAKCKQVHAQRENFHLLRRSSQPPKSTQEFQITNVIRTTSCSVLCLCLWNCNHLMENYRNPSRIMLNLRRSSSRCRWKR